MIVEFDEYQFEEWIRKELRNTNDTNKMGMYENESTIYIEEVFANLCSWELVCYLGEYLTEKENK